MRAYMIIGCFFIFGLFQCCAQKSKDYNLEQQVLKDYFQEMEVEYPKEGKHLVIIIPKIACHSCGVSLLNWLDKHVNNRNDNIVLLFSQEFHISDNLSEHIRSEVDWYDTFMQYNLKFASLNFYELNAGKIQGVENYGSDELAACFKSEMLQRAL